MGLCMSTNSDEAELKKRSQAIDRVLEEDSKRLRRECKILLLGRRGSYVLPSGLTSPKAPARVASPPSSSR